ncbi:hypothetical protein [Gymnodinialimonas sp.]
MTPKSEIDLRDLARVLLSGTVSYLLVHFLLLPQLINMGVSFPTYLYIGVAATGVLAVVISLLTRPRAASAPQMHPAE